jgi:ATP-dependent Lhr-like helicase
VTSDLFAMVLRELASHDLVVQSSDGTLLLGTKGERIVNHYSFYSAFVTPEEYHLVCDGHELGTLPISHPLSDGSYLIFAATRWRVVSVDVERRIVALTPAPAGRAPRFIGGGAQVHERVRQEMKAIYEDDVIPPFLDPLAKGLLEEGRRAYADHQLQRTPLIEHNGNTVLFPWTGDRVMDTLVVQIRERDLAVVRDGIAVVVNEISARTLISHLRALAAEGPADAVQLARTVANKIIEKHHIFLDEELLSVDYASARLDPEGTWHALVRIVGQFDAVGA